MGLFRAGWMFSFLVGYVSGAIGHKKLLIALGILMFSVGIGVMGFAQNYSTLIALSVMAGIGASFYHPLGTALLLKIFPGKRGLAIGVHDSLGGVGFFIAPFLAVYLAALVGWRSSLMLLMFPAVPIAIALMFIKDKHQSSSDTSTISRKTVSRRLGAYKRVLIALAVVSSLNSVVFWGTMNYTSVYFHEICGLSAFEAGAILSLINIMGIFGPLIGGHLTDRFGGRGVMALALGFESLSWLLFLSFHYPANLVFIVISALFSYICFPISFVITACHTTEEVYATAISIILGVSIGVSSICSLLIGWMADLFGLVFVFQLSALIAAVGALCCYFIPARQQIAR